MGASASLINNGKRLHLQHGPIDLIIDVRAAEEVVQQAYRQAAQRFNTVLIELVDELPDLRKATTTPCAFGGATSQRMWQAASRFQGEFTTPMIAVAGAVADEILDNLRQGLTIDRALVNNGGDIALYLGTEQHTDIGVVATPHSGDLVAKIRLTGHDSIGGVATSGRHGRSLSMGIADSVTVLAADAATADAAATLIANAVTLVDNVAIQRTRACELDPDSDLGTRLVTTDLGHLTGDEIAEALASGLAVAQQMKHSGQIVDAHLCLRDYYETTDQQLNHRLPIQQRNG